MHTDIHTETILRHQACTSAWFKNNNHLQENIHYSTGQQFTCNTAGCTTAYCHSTYASMAMMLVMQQTTSLLSSDLASTISWNTDRLLQIALSKASLIDQAL